MPTEQSFKGPLCSLSAYKHNIMDYVDVALRTSVYGAFEPPVFFFFNWSQEDIIATGQKLHKPLDRTDR